VYHAEVSEEAPPPGEMDEIMRHVEALNEEMRAAGSRKATRARRVPIEVRPFQDEAED